MNFKSIVKTIGDGAKKHSPEILVGVGIISAVGATVLACKATVDIQEPLKAAKDDIDETKRAKEEGFYEENPEESYAKDITSDYINAGKIIVKHYALPVALEVTAIGTIFASNNISRKRNASLTGALATVQGAYNQYRKNVVDKYGEDEDRNLLYGLTTKKVTVEEEDEETGKTKKVKEEVTFLDPDKNANQKWTRLYDESSSFWTKSRCYNRDVIAASRDYIQSIIDTRGWATPMDVWDRLDMLNGGPEVPADVMDWGWVRGQKVDYGIFDFADESKVEFMKGNERNLWITLNPNYIRGQIGNKKTAKRVATAKQSENY